MQRREVQLQREVADRAAKGPEFRFPFLDGVYQLKNVGDLPIVDQTEQSGQLILAREPERSGLGASGYRLVFIWNRL